MFQSAQVHPQAQEPRILEPVEAPPIGPSDLRREHGVALREAKLPGTFSERQKQSIFDATRIAKTRLPSVLEMGSIADTDAPEYFSDAVEKKPKRIPERTELRLQVIAMEHRRGRLGAGDLPFQSHRRKRRASLGKSWG